MFLSAFRRRAYEDERPDRPFMLGGDAPGHAAAERNALQIDLGKARPIDEGDGIPRGILRRLAGRTADPGLVEGDQRRGR